MLISFDDLEELGRRIALVNEDVAYFADESRIIGLQLASEHLSKAESLIENILEGAADEIFDVDPPEIDEFDDDDALLDFDL